MKTLPFCLASTALVLLPAAALRSMMAFIPAGNEPKSRMPASMEPWRMPRGSKTPLLAAGSLITMAVLLVFAVWNGLGADVEWFSPVFPPYMQMAGSRTALQYAVCAAWVLGTLPIFLIMAHHREMK